MKHIAHIFNIFSFKLYEIYISDTFTIEKQIRKTLHLEEDEKKLEKRKEND